MKYFNFRWLVSFLGFPLGGLFTFLAVGRMLSLTDTLIGGMIAGAALGTIQWLTVKPKLGPLWILGSSLGLAIGAALASFNVNLSNYSAEILPFAIITGFGIGLGQALSARWDLKAVLFWTISTAALWTLGWLITARVIVDMENNYIVFGASGAIIVTFLSGLVLNQIFIWESADGN